MISHFELRSIRLELWMVCWKETCQWRTRLIVNTTLTLVTWLKYTWLHGSEMLAKQTGFCFDNGWEENSGSGSICKKFICFYLLSTKHMKVCSVRNNNILYDILYLDFRMLLFCLTVFFEFILLKESSSDKIFFNFGLSKLELISKC